MAYTGGFRRSKTKKEDLPTTTIVEKRRKRLNHPYRKEKREEMEGWPSPDALEKKDN
jgi:hypothetical protein